MEMPFFVHPWDMQLDGRMSKFWLPWLVGMSGRLDAAADDNLGMPAETATAMVSVLMGGVLERHPKLRLCFAHGGDTGEKYQCSFSPGGSFPFTIGRIQHGFDVRPDLCQTDCQVSPRFNSTVLLK